MDYTLWITFGYGRELQYLKAEENMRNGMLNKNNTRSLEDYLLKIRKSEKENEEIYRNLMLQVDDLSHRTELISLKLDKLSVLNSTIASPTISNVPVNSLGLLTADTLKNNLQFSTPVSAVNTSSELYFSSLKPNVQSLSTQTENIVFCENCNSPISMLLNPVDQITAKNVRHTNEFQTRPSDVPMQNNFQNSVVSRDIYVNGTSNEDADRLKKYDSQYIPPTSDTSCHMTASSAKQVFGTERNHSVLLRHETEAATTFSESLRYEEHVVSETPTEKIHTESEDVEIAIDPTIVKSDNESMNHEFDFLESDKRDSVVSFQGNSVHGNLSHINSAATKEESLKSEIKSDHQNASSCEGVRKKSLQTTSDRTNEASDIKSDSSVSAGPRSPSVHSEHVSAASDTDSFYEKDTPLTATAAYQALLGNTLAVDRSQKPTSDSDTEDEVENALANAVRKPSNARLLETSQSQREEVKRDIPQETESKSVSRSSKPATFNKPQSKLSKSTRKVLGLETSSESEVELAVKPSTKTQNVDDDEFEFFD